MQTKLTLKDLLYSKLFIFLILLIFILKSSCYLGTSRLITDTIEIINLFLTAVIVFLYIINFKLNKTIVFLFLFCLTMIVSCYLGKYSTPKTFFNIYSSIIGLSLYLDMGLKYECKKIIQVLNKLFFILIFINIYTIIIYPNGLYIDSLYTNNWFFKYDNTHIVLYLPALLLNFLDYKYKGKMTFANILEVIMIAFGIIYCYSATSVVTFFLIIIYFIFRKRINKNRNFNMKNYLIIYIGIFIGIVLLRVQNIFEWLIVDILHKDLTFTTRTILWDRIMEYIKIKPWIGFGIEDSMIFRNKMGNMFYTHAHNTILDVLYKGGISALIFHSLFFYNSVKELIKNNKSIICKTISFLIFSLLIMMIFEARQEKIGLYIVLILSLNINRIISSIKEHNKKLVDEYE